MAKKNSESQYEGFACKRTVKVAIFYHTTQEETERTYWVGTQAKDGSCQSVIKTMSGTGLKALDKAFEFLQDL